MNYCYCVAHGAHISSVRSEMQNGELSNSIQKLRIQNGKAIMCVLLFKINSSEFELHRKVFDIVIPFKYPFIIIISFVSLVPPFVKSKCADYTPLP